MAKWKRLPNGNFINLEAVASITHFNGASSITFVHGESIMVPNKSPADILNGEDFDTVR